MVQTQWQQTLRRKIGLSGAFFRITYNQSAETKWTRRVFHRFNLAIGGGPLAQAQCLFRRLLAYSYSNDLGLYAEEIDGRTGDAQAVFRAIFVLCISSVDELSGPWRHRFLPFPLS